MPPGAASRSPGCLLPADHPPGPHPDRDPPGGRFDHMANPFTLLVLGARWTKVGVRLLQVFPMSDTRAAGTPLSVFDLLKLWLTSPVDLQHRALGIAERALTLLEQDPTLVREILSLMKEVSAYGR